MELKVRVLKYIFICLFGLGWVFIAGRAFLQLRQVEASLCCRARASGWCDFSCCRAWALACSGFIAVVCGLSCSSQALRLRLNSCSSWASLLCGTWDLLRSGTEPVSPASAGRFCTTEPPGKPKVRVLGLRMQTLFSPLYHLLYLFFLNFICFTLQYCIGFAIN